MTFILDDQQKINEFDQGGFLPSIAAFPKQCSQAWEEVKKVSVPESYKIVNKVVLAGMGGSGLGLDIVDCVFFDKLNFPIEVFNSYSLPNYVDEKTLYLASSYSGTTEEIIASLSEAIKRKAKILGITAGGELLELFRENNIPFYKINPTNNPCNQPRMGLGYSVTGVLGLLSLCGIISVSLPEQEDVQGVLEENNSLFSLVVPQNENSAKEIAGKIYNRITVLIGAEFLAGSLHVFRNQLHENAKNFAEYFLLPELNHHLMESLSMPKTNPQNLIFFFINSDLYHPLIKKRLSITKEVVEKNNIPVLEYNCRASSKLSQAFEVVHFGEYVNFYLSFLNGVDPVTVPWVDYFKKKLSE